MVERSAPPPPDADPRDLTDDDLTVAVTDLAGHLHAAEARLVKLIAEAQRRHLWARHDTKRPEDWVSFFCGFSRRTATEHTRVAAAIDRLPETTAAMGGASCRCARPR